MVHAPLGCFPDRCCYIRAVLVVLCLLRTHVHVCVERSLGVPATGCTVRWRRSRGLHCNTYTEVPGATTTVRTYSLVVRIRSSNPNNDGSQHYYEQGEGKRGWVLTYFGSDGHNKNKNKIKNGKKKQQ